MANFKASLVISAEVDKAIASMQKLNKTIEDNEKRFDQAGKALAGFGAVAVAGIGLAVKAGMEQEEQMKLLAAAMKNSGTYTEEAYKHNLEYAASLQAITTADDEQIMSIQRILTQYKIEGQALDMLTASTLDLAQAKTMDLSSAAELVAKTVGTSTNALAKQGLKMDELSSQTEKTAQVIQFISDTFGGQATAAANTFTGSLKQQKNMIGEVFEGIGMSLIPTIQKLTDIIKPITKGIGDWIAKHQELTATITIIVGALGGLSVVTGAILLTLPSIISALTTLLPLLKSAITLMLGVNPIVAIITALVAGFILLKNVVSQTSAVGQALNIVTQAIYFVFEKLYEMGKALINGVFIILSSVLKILIITFKDVWSIVNSLTSVFLAFGNVLKGQFSDAKKHILEAKASLSEFGDNAKQATAITESLSGKVKDYFSNLANAANKSNQEVEKSYSSLWESQLTRASMYYSWMESKLGEELTTHEDYLTLLSNMYDENNVLIMQQEDGLFNYKIGLLDRYFEYKTMMDAAQVAQEQVKSDRLKQIQASLNSALSTSFASSIKSMIDNGASFKDFMQNALNSIRDVFIEMAAKIAAEWLVKTALMSAATLAWKGIVVVANAAVGATSAAVSALRALPFPINIAAAAAAAAGAYSLIKGFFADGTRGFSGGTAVINEKGGEIVQLPNGTNVLNNAESLNMLARVGRSSSGGNVSRGITINFSGNTFLGTLDDIATAVSDKIYTNLQLQTNL